MLLNDTGYPKDWPVVHLDKITKRGSGHTPSKSHPEYWNGNIKWVSLADSYRLNSGYISDTDKNISPEGIKNSSAVLHPPETVILSRDAGVGKSAVTKEAMAVSQHFIAWDCNQVGKVAPWFLYYNLQFHQRELERQAVGSTIKTIGLPFFKNLEIALPPLPEQKKIAAILSTWDRAIEGTEKLLANSQQQKKALMQQLLTGKKRLPGFMGKWKTVTFEKIGKCIRGVTYKPDNLDTPQSYILLRANNIQNGRISYSDILKVDSRIVKKEKILSEGDIFICMANGSKNLVGKSAYYYSENSTETVGSFCSIFRTNKSNSSRFVFSLFESTFYRDKIEIILSGTSINNLKPSDIEGMSWFIPPVPEQQAIAAVLSTADEEITAIEADLSHLRQEKKALMQQLLTGKRRVKVD